MMCHDGTLSYMYKRPISTSLEVLDGEILPWETFSDSFPTILARRWKMLGWADFRPCEQVTRHNRRKKNKEKKKIQEWLGISRALAKYLICSSVVTFAEYQLLPVRNC